MKTPVSKGTARVLVGLVAFPTAWITAGGAGRRRAAPGDRWWWSPPPLGALAAIWMVERALALARMLLRWQAQRERIGTVGLAETVRADVVDTVRAVGGVVVSARAPRRRRATARRSARASSASRPTP